MSLLFSHVIYGKNAITEEYQGRREISENSFTFDGDIQPVTSRQTLAVTEGRISSGLIRVFSETALTISTEGDTEKARGTYVLFEGKWYEIILEASWNSKNPEVESINHYDYYAEYREKDVS